jgi:anti-sigma regulatory factor (Ser/Thr protein kinase)
MTDAELVCASTGLADRDGLASCMALTDEAATRLSLSEEDMFALRLAVEEACTNIVAHGYAGHAPGPMSVEMWLTRPAATSGQLTVLIRDRATPFHPDNAKEPDLDADADERAIGGLGWFFIKSLMNEVTYDSEDGGNCLRLVKLLTQLPPPPPHTTGKMG